MNKQYRLKPETIKSFDDIVNIFKYLQISFNVNDENAEHFKIIKEYCEEVNE